MRYLLENTDRPVIVRQHPVERLAIARSSDDYGALLRETYGFPGSERDLLERGLIWAGTHTAVKAVVALTLLLAAGSDRPAIGEHFAS